MRKINASLCTFISNTIVCIKIRGKFVNQTLNLMLTVHPEISSAQRAEVDMLCDQCQKEITIGEDYYYEEHSEEVLCADCTSEKVEIDL